MVAHSGAGRDREPRLTRLNVLLKADSKQLCSEFYCLCGGVACSTWYSSQYVTLRAYNSQYNPYRSVCVYGPF